MDGNMDAAAPVPAEAAVPAPAEPAPKAKRGRPRRQYVPGVGLAPGEMRVPGKPKTWTESATREATNFLYPEMPGAFVPSVIRKKPLPWLKDRYIQVYSASMGNHSISIFYCDWDQDQFEAILDDDFQKRIDRARAQLADRATYIMHKGMGLVGDGSAVAPSVTAAMAKVVEMLHAKGEQHGERKGFKLKVEGFDKAPEIPTTDPAFKAEK